MTLVKLVITITLLSMTSSPKECSLLGLMMILYTLHAAIDYPFAILRQLHPIRMNQPLTPQQRLMLHEKSLMEVLGTCLFFVSNYFLFQSAECRRSVPPIFYGLLSFVIVDYVGILIPLILCLAAIFCMPFLIRVLTSLDVALGLVGPTGATEDLINTIPVVKYRKPVSVPTAATSVATTAAANVALPPPAVLGQSQEDRSANNGPMSSTSATAATPTATTTQSDTIITIDANESSTSANAGADPHMMGISSTASTKQKQKPWRLAFGLRRKGDTKGDGSSSSDPSSTSPEDEYLTLEDEQDAVCSICLCEYEDEEELRKMPCLHYFHKACVDEWLKLHKSCPLCKREIDESADERSRSRRSPSQPSQPLIF
ncbi:hypothetical protein BGZ73_003565 [Actinomortierella ambigua]|nr:hypothetical protein BGZ73_003565 [Actinomortierella ambigua]